MKINIVNDSFFLISTQDINKKEIENTFKRMFMKLKSTYNFNVNGHFVINIYKDKYYGIVAEIIKDEDYSLYYSDQVDIEFNKYKNSTFVYEVKDISEYDLNNFNIYLYKDKLYLKIRNKIKTNEFYYLMENSILKYESEDILKFGKKIR